MTEPGPIPSKVVPEGRESRCSLTALLRPHGSPTACARGEILPLWPAEASGFEGPTGGYGFAWFGNLKVRGRMRRLLPPLLEVLYSLVLSW